MTGTYKLKPIPKRSWRIWIILLVAMLLALLIWRYFDIRIEQLKSGSVIEIGMLINTKNTTA